MQYEEFCAEFYKRATMMQHKVFCEEFYKHGCVTMKDWLGEYNLADVEQFIEVVEKTRH